ncbi:phage major tail tube protein [Metasolibacillus sp. FSL H7-0170]|uniref:phage major tail tube protein n=1 Tax=Metasolibacillus sp. FSL H7-0170 TaxID=2921431 RepID=UPI0031586FD3
MSAIIPEKLNDFRVYEPGNPDYKGISDIQLPSLEPLTESINGAGILGEYESPAFGHLGSMKLTLNWRVTSKELLSFFRPEAMEIDCRMANQEYYEQLGKHEFTANRLYVRGIPTKNDLGKAQKGSPYEGSTEIEVLHMKLECDGETLIEVDKINYIYKVGGVDYSQKLRDALGM